MFVRTCQDCGHRQQAKDPSSYKDQKREAWREVKCKRCGSEGLDYGSDGFELVDGKLIRKD